MSRWGSINGPKVRFESTEVWPEAGAGLPKPRRKKGRWRANSGKRLGSHKRPIVTRNQRKRRRDMQKRSRQRNR